LPSSDLGSVVEACLPKGTRGLPVAGAEELGGLDGLCTVFGERTREPRRRGAAALREQRRQRRCAEVHRARTIELESLRERRDAGLLRDV